MQNFDFLPLSRNVLIDEKVFSIYHLASSIVTPVVGAHEFYILIHDSVKDNDYKNIYRNDLLKFHGLSSISLEQSLLEIAYLGFGYSKEYSF